MRRRVQALFTEAWHLVLLVVGIGICIAGIAALVGAAAGEHGGREALVVVIAVGSAGVVSVAIAACIDPMGFPAYGVSVRPWPSPGAALRQAQKQSELMHEEETGLTPEHERQFRRDDLFYAGGILLVGLAVLLGYVFSWAGVPPANPFTG